MSSDCKFKPKKLKKLFSEEQVVLTSSDSLELKEFEEVFLV